MSVLLFLMSLLTTHQEVCHATIFGYPGDRHAGGDALLLGRPVAPGDVGIAHRTLPLGSYVLVTNVSTGQTVLTQVIDRGPYGAIHQGKWRVKKRLHGPGEWRGCADLTPDAARAIGHDGWDLVRLTTWPQEDIRQRRAKERSAARRDQS